MKLKLTIIVFIIFTLQSKTQNDKYQINGSARSYLFANQLNIENSLDSITSRKSNYGHNLLDLGISVFPNKESEVIGIFRLRNELGGFWGGGVVFDVRQLTLNGVAAKVVKYSIGDIDLQMTKYTLFNNNEEGTQNEADIFSLRRDVMHYDYFYNKNSWRMQGAKVEFNLLPSRNLEKIKFKGFITRQRPTDEQGRPERLFGGGNVKFVKSKKLFINLNTVNLFDLKKTSVIDSSYLFNNVTSSNFNYVIKSDSTHALNLSGEGGFSGNKYENFDDLDSPISMNDWFYDISTTLKLKKKKVTFTIGFKDIGKDFNSPAAQTKRIDFSKSSNLYQQFTNDYVGRQITLSDITNGNSNNSVKITPELMAYNVIYNNTNPYGDATPNRRGIYFNLKDLDTVKVKDSHFDFRLLQESSGSGTLRKKVFILSQLGTKLSLNEFFRVKKKLIFSLGYRNEITLRSGEDFEKINLNSNFINLGLNYELFNHFSLIAGHKFWKANGNEFQEVRDTYNSINDFENLSIDFTENISAFGVKYDFGNKNTLTIQYQNFNIRNGGTNGVDYGISDLIILFNLKF